MGRIIQHGSMIVLLTVLTQLGGIAWALSLTVRRWRVTYAASFVANPDLLVGAQPGTAPFHTGVYEVLDGN
jgi:hypothetical protein